MASSSSSSSSTLTTIEFNVHNCTRKSYRELIDSITAVCSKQDKHHGLPALLSRKRGLNNFFLLILSSTYLDISISIVFEISSLYLVGFKAKNVVWFFQEYKASIFHKIFGKINKGAPGEGDTINHFCEIRFSPRYAELENRAGGLGGPLCRTNLLLGFTQMQDSIAYLYVMERTAPDYQVLSHSVLILIQMIPEVCRLKKFYVRIMKIAKRVTDEYGDLCFATYTPSQFDADCQNEWGKLSKEISAKKNMKDELKNSVKVGSKNIRTVEQALKIVRILNSEKVE